MKRITCLVLMFLPFATLPACNSKPTVPTVPFEGPSQVRPYLHAYLDAPGGPPSISLAVAVDGKIVIASAVGFADIKNQRKATSETPYRTYSISKGITAVAVMQAAERSELNLDDNIREYLPAFPEKPWPIRLRHLLTHTSGIRHYKDNAGEISSTREYPTLSDSLVVFANDPLEFEPGTDFRYSSFAFNLLTGALEKVTHRDFGEVLEERIFSPAGMTHSSLTSASPPSLAKPYWKPRLGWHREVGELPNMSGKYGSGGIVSTPTDLIQLFLALERGSLLTPESAALMLREWAPETAPRQAFGWNVVIEEGRRWVYRTGASTGYCGVVEYLPDHGIVGAVLINQNQYPGRVQILETVLKYFAENQSREQNSLAPKALVEDSPGS